MAITVQALAQLPLFAGLRDDALQEIMPYLHERTFSPGQTIVLEGEPCQAVYFVIRCERFRRIVREHHEVALAVMERLATEVRRLTDMVEDLALHTVRARLARFLLAQAEDPQPSHRWTQEEIAAHIGTVREMVGRTLRAFTAAGLIHRERGRVVVADREGLEREATGVEQTSP